MFQSGSNKGFNITFANGFTISVQFGPGNYCDNYHCVDFDAPAKAMQDRNNACGVWGSKTAEVAIIKPDNSFYKIDKDSDVVGYQTPADVLKLMRLAEQL